MQPHTCCPIQDATIGSILQNGYGAEQKEQFRKAVLTRKHDKGFFRQHPKKLSFLNGQWSFADPQSLGKRDNN
jgi:hypothetical protein